MEILIGILIIFAIMLGASFAFQKDLKEIERTDPKYRQYLKDTLKI